MRYTKAALLIFGLGLMLGLVVVAGELPGFERVASGVMALSLVSLPFALLADGRGTAIVQRIRARFSGRKRPKRRVSRPAAAARPAATRPPARRRPTPRAPRRKRR
ncbi:MAG TPA: hypothetical protein VEK82_08245 [Stellaceae bacterium]|nr:hypothetical protein [Stellaceae bacterium]